MALPALATGFEVFVVVDATAARSADARSAAIHRLLHAGAALTTNHQLIAEWIETSSDPDQRSALSLLFSRR
jgi:nicotinamidase-related amidase